MSHDDILIVSFLSFGRFVCTFFTKLASVQSEPLSTTPSGWRIEAMDQVKLEDIIPQPSEFRLSNGETYHLRGLSLADQVWLVDTFGAAGVDRIFENMDGRSLCRIAFRLMITDSAVKFASQPIQIVNEDTGEVTESSAGGWRLLMCMVQGNKDLRVLAEAVTKSFGISEAIVDSAAETDSKKKMTQSTGSRSSTHLPASTDGRRSTSPRRQGVKSRSSSEPSTRGRASAS